MTNSPDIAEAYREDQHGPFESGRLSKEELLNIWCCDMERCLVEAGCEIASTHGVWQVFESPDSKSGHVKLETVLAESPHKWLAYFQACKKLKEQGHGPQAT